MIKAIFWDNDGVLVDTERLYFMATQEMLATVGVSLTKEQYVDFILVDGKGAWHLAAEKGVTPEGIEGLRAKRNILYNSLLQKEPIAIEGVQDVLERLSAKYTMGIVTSSLPGHFSAIHERTGFLKYFKFAITPEDFTHSKPHPEPYLLALQRSGLDADECVVIEDSQRGLTAATRAGLRCIIIPNEFNRESSFAGAYRVMGNISELLNEL